MFKTQADAVDREREVLKALERGIPAPVNRNMTLAEAADGYLAAKARKKSLPEDRRLLDQLKGGHQRASG